MLWGFFKKLVIADRLAIYVNQVYNHPDAFQAAPVIMATYFFAFQIYCDFSGYSDIAIGGARVFGYDLMNNFKRPYASKSVQEFWRNWHISLSTWFKDYLYIPLGGNRCTNRRLAVNLFIVFVVSGLWHGPNWTFIAWGALHGLFLILSVFTLPIRNKIASAVGLDRIPIVHGFFRNLIVFNLVVFAWIFFRANTISDAFKFLETIYRFNFQWSHVPLRIFTLYEIKIALSAIAFMELIQFLQRKQSIKGLLIELPIYVRWPVYYTAIVSILIFGTFNLTEFIYFQF